MNCKYTYKGVQYNSYWELRAAILNEESQDYRKTTGLLASADTRQSDVKEAIELVKLDFNLSQDDGELIVTDSTISGKYDIQHYIDSEYFEPEQKFYKKKNREEYKRVCLEKGMTEEQVELQFKNEKTIGADAYAIHDIINNLILNSDTEEAWQYATVSFINKRIQEANTGTGRFMSISDLEFKQNIIQAYKRLKPFSAQIAKQIRESRHQAFLNNKIDKVTSKIIKNIGLSEKLPNGITLLGHIDSVIIDKDGNIDIYQYKPSADMHEVWAEMKQKKFNLEMAFLRRMLISKLQARGMKTSDIHINMHLVPIFMNYDANMDLKDTTFRQPIDVMVKFGKYDLAQEDDIINQEIPIKNMFIGDVSDEVDKGKSHTDVMFNIEHLYKHKIEDTVNSFIKYQYKENGEGRIKKCPPDSEYSYEIRLSGKAVKYIKESTSPLRHNEEIDEYLTNYFNSEEYQADQVLRTLIKEIKVARQTNTMDFSSFKNAQPIIMQALFKYLLPKGFLESQNYEWDIVENEDLINQHILLFRSKSGQVDALVLSTSDLYKVNEVNGSTNIMNSYLSDAQSGELFNYNCSYGHIEQINALNILNQVLPQIGEDYKLGNIQVISAFRGGQQMSSTFSNLITKYYNPIVDLVNANNEGLNMQSNFGNFQYVDDYQLILDYANDLLQESTYADQSAIKIKTKEALENLSQANTDAARRAALKSFLEFLQNEYQIKNIAKTNNFSSLDYNQKFLYELYNQACYVYNTLNGVYTETQFKPLSSLESWFMSPIDISDNNYRAITRIVNKTINLANEEIMKQCIPIQNFVREYFKACGYTELEGSLIGDENKYFLPLFEQDSYGNPTMIFKNPFTSVELKEHERLFLKKALFHFAKITNKMHNKEFTYSSYEDPNFKKLLDTDPVYLRAPLMRGSGTLSVRSLKDKWNHLKELVKNPLDTFTKYQMDLDKQNGQNATLDYLMAQGVKNPFSSSMSSDDTLRQEMLDTHDSSFWEVNIPALLYSYVAQEERTKQFNNSLVLIQSILFHTRALSINANNKAYLNWFEKEVGKYLKVNIFRESILEDTSKKIFSVVNPLKSLISKIFLGFNFKSMVRDTLEGFQQNYIKIATKQTDLTAANLTKAYSYVFKGSFTNVRSVTFLNQLCIQYGLSNLDFANIATGLRTDRSGVSHIGDIMYNTMKRPDFLNRMTLFVARALQDGVIDIDSTGNLTKNSAINITKEGELTYDATLDKRFIDYFKGTKGSEKYLQAKARYYASVRGYNKDHIESPIEYMGNKLPMPYSLTEIDRIKDFANHIYANYDLNGKAMWENMAIGMGFGHFTTYLNATIGNYFSKKRLVESDKFEQETVNGRPLFIKSDGTLTFEQSEDSIPAMKNVPIVVQGIIGTYGTLFKTLIDKRSLTECHKYLQANPQEFKNFIKGLSDLFYFAFMTILFKSVLVPGFDAWYKDMAKKNVVVAGLSKGIFKGAQQSPNNFCGPFGVVSASGDISVPAYTYPVTELKNMFTMATNPNFLDDPVKQLSIFTLSSIPATSVFAQALKINSNNTNSNT